jgi:DME family drug/metabolite transporter
VTIATSSVTPAAHVWRGLVLVCVAGVLWGTIGPAVRLVHDESPLSVLTIGAYRAITAVAALVAASWVSGRLGSCVRLARRRPGRVTAVGLLTATFMLLFFLAVVATGVSVATVVGLGFAPVLLLVLTSARERRLPSPGQAGTVTTAVVGLLLVSGAGAAEDVAPHPALGVLAALGSGAAYALSTEVGAQLSQSDDPLTVTTVTMSVTAGVLVPGGLALAYLRDETMTTGDTGTWLHLAYLGVVTMALAYVLLFAGLRSTPSGAAVVLTLLEPVTAVVIAVVFLGERLTPTSVGGLLLILAAIGSLGRQPEGPQPQ